MSDTMFLKQASYFFVLPEHMLNDLEPSEFMEADFGTIRLEMVRLCLKVQCQENAWYILQIPIIILGILILTNL